jgi:inner membrane protein YidH
MTQDDGEHAGANAAYTEKERPVIHSKKVTDHLANERTFLAWIRTGLATITFGFVIERFGLLLRELGLKNQAVIPLPVPFSAVIGVSLTLLGVAVIIIALLNFLHIRRSIDSETFHPSARFAVLLTVLTGLVGLLLAVYLILAVV